MNINFIRIMDLLLRCLSCLIVVFAVIGGIKSFSPVPYMDMWDGYLEFYTRVLSADYGVWWSQHNEHRILISRLLFWLDFKFFNATLVSLIVINYCLVFLAFIIFSSFIKAVAAQKEYKIENTSFFLILSLLFLWSQQNNLTWGFQSQFFLAHTLPLASMYFISKFCVEKKEQYFYLSLVLGVLSIGCMANGLLVLPFLLVYCLIFRLGKRRAVTIFIASLITWIIYFYDYYSIEGHGALIDTFINEPFASIRYVFRFIGSPFYYLFGNKLFSEIAGATLIISSSYLVLRYIKEGISLYKYETGLLFFILYIGATALASAGARLTFGIDQAFASRYTTPAIMAWIALFILFIPLWRKLYKTREPSLIALVFITGFIFIRQLETAVLENKQFIVFGKEIGALSIELAASDQEWVSYFLFPSAEWAQKTAEVAVQLNLSIFGSPLIKDLRERVGMRFDNIENYQQECIGFLDGIKNINGKYSRISGWAFDQKNNHSPRNLFLVSSGVVVGYALVGAPRKDVGVLISEHALYSGFTGYLLSNTKGSITAYSEKGATCSLKLR